LTDVSFLWGPFLYPAYSQLACASPRRASSQALAAGIGRPIVSSLTEDYRMLGSDKAIIGALAILIIGIVVSVVLIG
jgi:hypothetical protein